MWKKMSWVFWVSGILPSEFVAYKYIAAGNVVALLLSIKATIAYIPAAVDVFGKLCQFNYFMFYATSVSHIIWAYNNRASFSAITVELAGRALLDHSIIEQLSCMFLYIYNLVGFVYFVSVLGVLGGTARFWVSFVLQLIMMQHLGLVSQLTDGFSLVNNQLREVVQRTPPELDLREQLISLFRQHARLRCLVQDVNAHYGLFYLLFMANQLLSFLLHIYLFCTTITDEVRVNLVGVIIYTYIFISIIIPCLVCHTCSEEANNTVLIAHKMVNIRTPADIMEEVKTFSLGCFNLPTSFSAAGVFTINRRLVTKFASICLTYLTISLQLRDVDFPKGLSTNHTNISNLTLEN